MATVERRKSPKASAAANGASETSHLVPKSDKIVISEHGRAMDKRLDTHELYVPRILICAAEIDQYPILSCSYEFGGPWGVCAIMTGFPILMYYLWICLWFYDGKLVHPTSVDDIQPFFWRMWAHVAKVCIEFTNIQLV